MKKVLKISLIVLIIGAFGGTIFYLYQNSKEKPTEYQTQKPQITDIIKKTVATGEVIPRNEIEIKPQVSGIVKKLYVQPGDTVKEGDRIAKVKIIPDMVNLNNARSRVNKANISYEDAKKEFDRQKKIYEKGVIPEAEYQKYKVALENAKEELEAAKNNLQLIKEGAIDKQGESSNTLIRSTIKGTVLDVPVERGNSVIEANNFNDGTTIASVADMGDMIFKGKVDETEVGRLKQGMDLNLQIGAIQDQRFDAVLEYIAPKGIEENGAVQFEIKADVKQKEDQFIRAGYSANANIIMEKKDSVLAISESLLQFKNDTTFVEVETEQQEYKKVYPEFGISDGINIEVKSGISKEDKIKDPTRRE
ncbi:MAG: efflux RND transporter periplasmic adaptor subunit, partial [Bacteroidota bacterium]